MLNPKISPNLNDFFRNFSKKVDRFEVCTLDVLFRQVSTFLKDSTALVYGLGGF